jgi:hypothetical protein
MTTDPRPDLRAQIEALPDFRDRDDSPWPWVSRRAVLALIPPGSVLVTRETLAEAVMGVEIVPGVYVRDEMPELGDRIILAVRRVAALTPEPTDD